MAPRRVPPYASTEGASRDPAVTVERGDRLGDRALI